MKVRSRDPESCGDMQDNLLEMVRPAQVQMMSATKTQTLGKKRSDNSCSQPLWRPVMIYPFQMHKRI